MTEQTQVVSMPLPFGQEWVWFADANIVGVAAHLDADGRERCLSELQAEWRRSLMRVVPTACPGAA